MEYLDIRNEDGSLTGRVKERSLAHRDGDLHGTAHVWLVRKNCLGRWEVLLQKRSADKDSFPGVYDVSSAGHLPAGEDFRKSAVRELKEELGISAGPDQLSFIGWEREEIHTEFYGRPWNNHELSAVYALYFDGEPDQMRLQESEVEAVLWTDYETCLEKLRDGSLPNCISVEEFQMLGGFLHGKRDKDQCHAHSGAE